MLKVVLVVVVVGVTLYLLLRLLERRADAGDQPRRTLAPDDDVEFLREVDRRQRRQRPPQTDDD